MARALEEAIRAGEELVAEGAGPVQLPVLVGTLRLTLMVVEGRRGAPFAPESPDPFAPPEGAAHARPPTGPPRYGRARPPPAARRTDALDARPGGRGRVPVGSLQGWEQARRMPRLEAAIRLADALDITLDEPVGRTKGGGR